MSFAYTSGDAILKEILRRNLPTLSVDDKMTLAAVIEDNILRIHEDADGNPIPDELDAALQRIFGVEEVKEFTKNSQTQLLAAAHVMRTAHTKIFDDNGDPTKVSALPPREKFQEAMGKKDSVASEMIRQDIEYERELLISIRQYAYLYTEKKLGIAAYNITDSEGKKIDQELEYRRYLQHLAGSGETAPKKKKEMGNNLIRAVQHRADQMMLRALSSNAQKQNDSEIALLDAAEANKPRPINTRLPESYINPDASEEGVVPALRGAMPTEHRERLCMYIVNQLVATPFEIAPEIEAILDRDAKIISRATFTRSIEDDPLIKKLVGQYMHMEELREENTEPTQAFEKAFAEAQAELEKKVGADKVYYMLQSIEHLARDRLAIFKPLREYAELYTREKLNIIKDDTDCEMALSTLEARITKQCPEIAEVLISYLEHDIDLSTTEALYRLWLHPSAPSGARSH